MRLKKTRGIVTLVSLVLVLGACSPAPSLAADAPAEPVAAADIPVTVQGFLPGYTDSGLAQSMSSCVAQVPIPETMANEVHARWQVQVDVQNVYVPHSATEVRISLLRDAHVVASRWQRETALDAAPRAGLCGTVSSLTQQLWASASAGDMVYAAKRQGEGDSPQSHTG